MKNIAYIIVLIIITSCMTTFDDLDELTLVNNPKDSLSMIVEKDLITGSIISIQNVLYNESAQRKLQLKDDNTFIEYFYYNESNLINYINNSKNQRIASFYYIDGRLSGSNKLGVGSEYYDYINSQLVTSRRYLQNNIYISTYEYQDNHITRRKEDTYYLNHSSLSTTQVWVKTFLN